jgi:hypothetical protein
MWLGQLIVVDDKILSSFSLKTMKATTPSLVVGTLSVALFGSTMR